MAISVPADSAESHKRRAILLSVIGAKAYDVVSEACSPIPPSEKTYAQLTTILKNHFAPKKLVITERYRFHNFTQREWESVTAFAANLKHLASTCQFGTHLNTALRDRFVCGHRSMETQKKLLTEEHPFDAALKVALGAEAAEKDVAAFSQESSASVNKVDSGNRRCFQPTQRRKGPGKRGKFNSSSSNIKDRSKCLSCGKKCKYRNYTCHSCGKVGHISEACKGKPQKVQQLEGSENPQTSPPDDSVDPFSLSLYNLSSGQQGIEIPVELNGTSLLMELDTGAGVSVISEETYKKHFSGTPLMPSNTRLRAYTGHPLKVHGQIIAHLKYQDQSTDVPLLVVQGSGPSLFGRGWLSRIKLDWTKICNIRVSETDLPQGVASQLRATIQNHPNVFKPSFARLVLSPMLFRKPLKLNTTVSSQTEFSNGWNSVNGLPQLFMSPRQMELHVLVVIMPLLSTPSFTSLSIQFPSRRMSS